MLIGPMLTFQHFPLACAWRGPTSCIVCVYVEHSVPRERERERGKRVEVVNAQWRLKRPGTSDVSWRCVGINVQPVWTFPVCYPDLWRVKVVGYLRCEDCTLNIPRWFLCYISLVFICTILVFDGLKHADFFLEIPKNALVVMFLFSLFLLSI